MAAKKKPKDEYKRDSKGLFQPGNKGGPGNPVHSHMKEFRKAVFECVTREDFEAICAALVKKAREGDTVAAGMVLERLLGKADLWSKLHEIDVLHGEMVDIKGMIDELRSSLEAGEGNGRRNGRIGGRFS